MRNFVFHVKGRTQLGLSENRQLEENTWSLKGGNNSGKQDYVMRCSIICILYIIWMIKSKHARLEEHVVCLAEIRNGKILLRKPESKSLLKTMDL
jgi:hypothetical protein